MDVLETSISELVARQREYFNSGATRPLSFRMDALKKLQAGIRENGALINEALMRDLNKSNFETYISETGLLLEEIGHHLKRLPRWMKNKRVPTPLAQFHARSHLAPEPYGVALIISPWNYPFLLCIEPLIGAISAGNCAVVKPSAYAPATSRAVAKLLSDIFPAQFVAVVEGGREQNRALLEERFDYIFFTGSAEVGRVVMAAAAKHLTPVTLELGGKNPVIVDETANIALAARRIAFGKALNAGQACVAPDYLFVHESVKDAFVAAYAAALDAFFPDGNMADFTRIVNEKHFNRLLNLTGNEKIAAGGGHDAASRLIAPALIVDAAPDSPVMRKEIFGPVLPLMTYARLDECVAFIRARPKPLALYLFTSNRDMPKRVLGACSSGGCCVNDTLVHITTPYMGFGGVGESGMGSYHGKFSFDTFTHYRSVMERSTWIDLPLRYRPYTERALNTIKKLVK